MRRSWSNEYHNEHAEVTRGAMRISIRGPLCSKAFMMSEMLLSYGRATPIMENGMLTLDLALAKLLEFRLGS